MGILVDCVDFMAMVNPVPYTSHDNDCWYPNDMIGHIVVAQYTRCRVGEAACILGQLSSYGYIAGEVMRNADRLSRYHAAAVKAPLLPSLLMEHRWSKEYNRTIQSVRPVRFSQAVDLDLTFTPGYMAEVDRSLQRYLGEEDGGNNEITVYSFQGW